MIQGGIDLLEGGEFTVQISLSADPDHRRHRGADGRLHAG
jgi:hypothetical protein